MLALQRLRRSLKFDVFEDADVHLVLNDLTLVARHHTISRLLKNGEIKKLKRGIYMFNVHNQRVGVSKFSVASRLCGPSYISFESALSYHGLIPESVRVTTSACALPKKKLFETFLGDFSFFPLSTEAFALGTEYIKTKAGSFVMATPVKALFDLVFIQRKNYQSTSEIDSDLRIEGSALTKTLKPWRAHEIEDLGKSYGRPNTYNLAQLLVKEHK